MKHQNHVQGSQKAPQSHSFATGSIPTHPAPQWTIQSDLLSLQRNTPVSHLQYHKAICEVSWAGRYNWIRNQHRQSVAPLQQKPTPASFEVFGSLCEPLRHHSTCLLPIRVAQSHFVCTQCMHLLCFTSLHFTSLHFESGTLCCNSWLENNLALYSNTLQLKLCS